MKLREYVSVHLFSFSRCGLWQKERDNLLSLSIIVLVWLGFRIYVYTMDWWHIMEMLPEEDLGWVAFPGAYLRDHFFDAMYYFRQEPPFPQFILGVMIKVFGWPFPIPIAPFFLSILCLFSAIFMRDIARFFGVNNFVSTGIALLWVLSVDCVSFEIDAYPKAFYEMLTGFLFIASLWVLVRYFTKKSDFLLLTFFLVIGLMVMTRSSLSLFFMISIAIALLVGGRKAVIFGLIPLVLQVGFSLKNYLAYGEFYLETTSFSSANFASSLYRSGRMGDFIDFSSASGKDYCYVGVYRGTAPTKDCAIRLEEAKKKDNAMSEKLGFQMDSYGSFYLREVSKSLDSEFVMYLLSHPKAVIDIFWGAYRLYWGSSRNELTPVMGMLNSKLFYFLEWVNDGVRYINIILIHSVFLYATFIVFKNKMFIGDRNAKVIVFLYAAISFFYVSLVTSIADFSENNRYRFAIEGVIWLLPVMSFSLLKNNPVEK